MKMNQLHPPVTATATGPVPAPKGPRERRVRFGHLTLALALIVVGALGTATLVTTVASGGTYLALATDVAYGAPLTDAHLTEVRIPNPPALEPIPASARSRVVGRYATMPLAKGSILTPAQVAAEPLPGPGQRIVGLTLRRDRLPAQVPQPGDVITLVASPDRGADGDTAPRTFPATVTAVAGADPGGGFFSSGSRTVTVDVAVTTDDAPEVAVLAADNRITIVLGGG